MMISIKLLCLFLGVWFTAINSAKAIGKDEISALNFLTQAVGITGFLALQFNLF